MTTIVTTTTRMRNAAVILTDRMCEKRVSKRVKIYDRKCRGLYVSIIPAGVATFAFKFTDPGASKQRTITFGVYNPETFRVEDARSKVYALKGKGPATLVAEMHQNRVGKGKHGKTVAEIIELRIDWMQQPEEKKDGEMRPRIESWQNVASHLRRFVKPSLGKMIASDVTRHDIAALSNDILDGKYGVASVSNARHMRRAASGLYSWAAEARRDFVPETCRPCFNLPKLPVEHARERVLNAEEIRKFWHGLDRDDLPYDRKTRLALKFALVSMLRSTELLGARRDELFDLADPTARRFDVAAKRVKKRRVIQQPLSELAFEIINEAMEDGRQYVFSSPVGDQPLHRQAMATALRGRPDKDAPGLCELLGLKPFTPHDLRRTSATLAGELGFSDAAIAKCLDHAVTKDDGEKVNRVTGIYNQSKRMNQKRAVLDGIAAELRRIVGQPADTKLKLVA
jgi:integrase